MKLSTKWFVLYLKRPRNVVWAFHWKEGLKILYSGRSKGEALSTYLSNQPLLRDGERLVWICEDQTVREEIETLQTVTVRRRIILK